ncbi:MAG: hypothetical protein KIH69_003630 [Anaerolineae bacterium]|nr:hypothetical protein [Anaerolineae bacterium]
MTQLQTKIPDYLYQQVSQLSEREHIEIDQIVAMALSAHVALWLNEDFLQKRGRRGSWERFQQRLENVPNVEPDDYDKLPIPLQ